MNRIVMLDELTINKIAAGEVVERPASVIKELVENSIDASAKRITVEIAEGGKEYIKVSDDGDGILPQDIPLAFERHSTSKLRSIEDFDHLLSNGFRGEALSSIAAVAKIEMLTNTDESSLGKIVRVWDGEIQSIQDVGVKKGTIIKVEDLFFNTPARKKFLKTNATETTQISEILSRLAIINHDIAFKYISNGKEIFKTIGDGGMLPAIASIYGRSISDNLLKVDFDSPRIKIQGYISNTGLYQSNRKKENIFVNKRYIRTSPLIFVIENLYKELIPIGKYPVFFLDISVDPQYIDPNVHPSKLEIKIANELDIADPLSNVIRETLFKASRNFIPEVKIKSYYETSTKDERSVQSDFQSVPNRFKYQEFEPDLDEKTEVIHPSESKNMPQNPSQSLPKESVAVHKIDTTANDGSQNFLRSNSLTNVSDSSFAYLSNDKKEMDETKENKQESLFSSDDIFDYTQLKIVGVALNTYIVVTYRNSIFMIDQHAAHERVLYERFIQKLDLTNTARTFESQELLVADIVEFASFEYERILEQRSLLQKLGFVIDDFGFNRIAVRTYPVLFEKEQGMEFFKEVTDLLLDEKKIDLNRQFEDKLARMACRKAIKANHIIGEAEIRLLFEQLNACDNKYTCPHGRPIFVEFSQHEIEKMFKRIV